MDENTRQRLEEMERKFALLQRQTNGVLARLNYLEAQDANMLRILYRESVALSDGRTEAQRIRVAHGLMVHKAGAALPVVNHGGLDDDERT